MFKNFNIKTVIGVGEGNHKIYVTPSSLCHLCGSSEEQWQTDYDSLWTFLSENSENKNFIVIGDLNSRVSSLQSLLLDVPLNNNW